MRLLTAGEQRLTTDRPTDRRTAVIAVVLCLSEGCVCSACWCMSALGTILLEATDLSSGADISRLYGHRR